jgi:hypothetical protein
MNVRTVANWNRESFMMTAIILLTAWVALALATLPAWAQGSNHKWVKSGTDTGLGFVICVDQNNIVKDANGHTQFEALLSCVGEIIITIDVDCNQDMSGKDITMKSFPYSTDGTYDWAKIKGESTKNSSLLGQSAKFVCNK